MVGVRSATDEDTVMRGSQDALCRGSEVTANQVYRRDLPVDQQSPQLVSRVKPASSSCAVREREVSVVLLAERNRMAREVGK